MMKNINKIGWKKPFFTALFFFSLSGITGWSDQGYKIIEEKKYDLSDAHNMRQYQDVILDCGKEGQANFTISYPKKVPSTGLPCIIIVGGLKTGRESLQFIPDHGDCILVAYEYPKTLQKLRKINILWNLYTVRKTALEVPSQLLKMVEYLKNQPFINQEPINMMGYSFGATFIPVTYAHSQKRKIELGLGVMAYGGAGLYCLFKANLPLPRLFRGPLASIGAAIFKPIDPIIYAPEMQGDFLFINGIFDKQIPLDCANRLQKLVPDPKTIINLETVHMHPDNKEINLQLIDISRSWVEKKRQETNAN